MPMNGGTRMLRARRKDINVKPNRRLDRKSSRGMLFENEELRMRTITINAEVEQGQHALKKLRRENEQLRREMWSLRDEYDKMEKLLRKKETDEDSDQENSDSDDNYSQTEDTDDDKKPEDESGEGSELPTGENADGVQSGTKFGNATTVRAFDGLSVIDEQTEETTTQTTESAIGYGTGSRGDSANRTLNQIAPGALRMYEDPSDSFPSFYDSYNVKTGHRKKGFPAYDGDPTYVPYGGTDWPDNGYDVRPASPYPYPESVQPSYRKRFEVLQNLPPMVPRVDENGWVFPNPAKTEFQLFQRETGNFVDISDKSVTSPISIQIPQEVNYSVVQDRTGPDIFVSNACAKKIVTGSGESRGGGGEGGDEIMKGVEAEIEKIEIGDRLESNAKTLQNESAITKEGVAGGKLTTAKSVDDESGNRCGPFEESVPCQNPNHKDVQKVFDSGEMAGADKSSSTYQSKLIVTLKTPASRTLKRVPPVQVPRTYQTLGCGAKADYGKRYFPECRSGKMDVAPTEDIPVRDGPGLLAEAEAPVKAVKIPPAPPPRTTSCLGATIPEPPAVQHRTFRGDNFFANRDHYPEAFAHNPLVLSEPMATSSPAISPLFFQRGHNLSLDNLHRKPVTTNDESSAEDISTKRSRDGRIPRMEPPHLNKSVSSPSFGTFLRRKPSENSVSSLENGSSLRRHAGLADRKTYRGNPQNNASVSSSSGLDSPTKCDRRKRRVSIKFNKKHMEDITCESSGSKIRGKTKARQEETDATTSERERTNSVSSRASSGRRKLSISSSRTYINDEKIPWCGCWGNGCV